MKSVAFHFGQNIHSGFGLLMIGTMSPELSKLAQSGHTDHCELTYLIRYYDTVILQD